MRQRAVSELDSLVTEVAALLTEQGDGLWIEAPRNPNQLWLAARLSEYTTPDAIRYKRTLTDAVAMVKLKSFGVASRPQFAEEGKIHDLLMKLAEVGDSLMISGDDDWWVLQAERLKIHAVGKSLFETVAVLHGAINTYISDTALDQQT